MGRSVWYFSTSRITCTALSSLSNDAWQHSENVAHQRSSPKPWRSGLLLGQSAHMTACIADLSYSVSSLSRGQTVSLWPRAPTINHIVSINYLAWAKTLLRGKILQGFRGYLPGTSQEPHLSLERSGLGQARPPGSILYRTVGLINEKRAVLKRKLVNEMKRSERTNRIKMTKSPSSLTIRRWLVTLAGFVCLFVWRGGGRPPCREMSREGSRAWEAATMNPHEELGWGDKGGGRVEARRRHTKSWVPTNGLKRKSN